MFRVLYKQFYHPDVDNRRQTHYRVPSVIMLRDVMSVDRCCASPEEVTRSTTVVWSRLISSRHGDWCTPHFPRHPTHPFYNTPGSRLPMNVRVVSSASNRTRTSFSSKRSSIDDPLIPWLFWTWSVSRREKEVEDGVLSTVVRENYVSLDLRPYSDSHSYRELKKEKTSCRLFNTERGLKASLSASLWVLQVSLIPSNYKYQ